MVFHSCWGYILHVDQTAWRIFFGTIIQKITVCHCLYSNTDNFLTWIQPDENLVRMSFRASNPILMTTTQRNFWIFLTAFATLIPSYQLWHMFNNRNALRSYHGCGFEREYRGGHCSYRPNPESFSEEKILRGAAVELSVPPRYLPEGQALEVDCVLYRDMDGSLTNAYFTTELPEMMSEAAWPLLNSLAGSLPLDEGSVSVVTVLFYPQSY